MRKSLISFAAMAAVLLAFPQAHAQQPEKKIPVPADYREWVYMTSGLDMTYAAAASPHTGPSVFDNVFVNPEAWRTFKQTGTWPDGTTFVLENRMAEQNVSISRGGHTQGHAIDGIELHQKRAGQWAFYVLDKDGTEHLVAKPAGCYTCHEAHAAVDTTFVQFYPTALPVAKAQNTISKAYLTELATPPAK
ncbi:hypothetical protein GCM10022270_28170 [Terriglobus aquaticus]